MESQNVEPNAGQAGEPVVAQAGESAVRVTARADTEAAMTAGAEAREEPLDKIETLIVKDFVQQFPNLVSANCYGCRNEKGSQRDHDLCCSSERRQINVTFRQYYRTLFNKIKVEMNK